MLQPLPESYFVSLENSGASQTMQWYFPGDFVFQYSPVNARSVPAFWVTNQAWRSACACIAAALSNGVWAYSVAASRAKRSSASSP